MGAVAAVNGDFFDIGVTGAPRGIGIDNGSLVHGPSSGVFALATGDANKVGVSRWTAGTGYVIADAVRVTRV